ncbi:MAG: hypothetical protein ACP5QT_07450 [Brevinematia bacterium]
MKNIYEEKRARLGINRLRTEEQKKLFNDFVNAGGEVIDLRADEKSTLNQKLEEWIREKEREYRQKLARENETQKSFVATQKNSDYETKAIKPPYSTPITKAKKKKEENPTPYFFSSLASKLTCMIFGIFPIFRNRFTRRFLELTFYRLQNNLLDAQQILYNIFQTDEKLTERIRNFLTKAGYTYYFEIVYRFYLLYEDELFTRLFESASDYDNPIFYSKPYFIELFKRILSIYRYYPTINLAFSKILEEEKRICNTDYKLNEVRLSRLFEASKFVFEKYFPKLLILIDFYYKEEIASRLKPRTFKEFLNITEKDIMGYWNKVWESESHKKKEKVETEKPPVVEELTSKKISPAITEGLTNINKNLDFMNILNYFVSVKDPKMLLSFNDKIFITWVLLEYFDKFYSPLLLSNSIIFQVTFNAGQRVDVKTNLKDLYYDINSSYKNFKEYLSIVAELNKTASGVVGSKELFSLTQKLELQRTQISKKIRTDLSLILKKIIDNIELIFIDYNFEKKIILNPEELIYLETNFCGKKLTYNKKIIDMFKDVYDFVSAFHFLLNDGDLSGTLLSVVKPKYLSWSEVNKPEASNESGQTK